MAALWAELSEPEDTADRRGSARRTLRLIASAARAHVTNEVLILDLSTTGMMLKTSAPLATGEAIEVELPEVGAVPARVVWRREPYFGCEFLTRAPVAAVSAALLQSAPRLREPLAATLPSSFRDRSTKGRPGPAGEGLTIILLILMLVAFGTFMLAMLTPPTLMH